MSQNRRISSHMLLLRTISLIVAPWKFDVLKANTFALEVSLLSKHFRNTEKVFKILKKRKEIVCLLWLSQCKLCLLHSDNRDSHISKVVETQLFNLTLVLNLRMSVIQCKYNSTRQVLTAVHTITNTLTT